MIHRNSMEAHRTTRHDQRCRAILDELQRGGPGTARELKDRMGLTDMDQIRPRLTDMGPPTDKFPMRPHLVREIGNKRCQVTGKNVAIFDLAMRPVLPVPSDDLFDAVVGANRATANFLREGK